MKTPDKQIFSTLQAFNHDDVLKAIELYQDGLKNQNELAKSQLMDDGWVPQEEKPENREFYFFDNRYWVQTESARKADIDKRKKALEKFRTKSQNSAKNKKYTGQKMDLSLTNIVCPKCGSKMYKQPVCGRCRDGKRGYKIRLICENNPDHEILL